MPVFLAVLEKEGCSPCIQCHHIEANWPTTLIIYLSDMHVQHEVATISITLQAGISTPPTPSAVETDSPILFFRRGALSGHSADNTLMAIGNYVTAGTGRAVYFCSLPRPGAGGKAGGYWIWQRAAGSAHTGLRRYPSAARVSGLSTTEKSPVAETSSDRGLGFT